MLCTNCSLESVSPEHSLDASFRSTLKESKNPTAMLLLGRAWIRAICIRKCGLIGVDCICHFGIGDAF